MLHDGFRAHDETPKFLTRSISGSFSTSTLETSFAWVKRSAQSHARARRRAVRRFQDVLRGTT